MTDEEKFRLLCSLAKQEQEHRRRVLHDAAEVAACDRRLAFLEEEARKILLGQPAV